MRSEFAVSDPRLPRLATREVGGSLDVTQRSPLCVCTSFCLTPGPAQLLGRDTERQRKGRRPGVYKALPLVFQRSAALGEGGYAAVPLAPRSYYVSCSLERPMGTWVCSIATVQAKVCIMRVCEALQSPVQYVRCNYGYHRITAWQRLRCASLCSVGRGGKRGRGKIPYW